MSTAVPIPEAAQPGRSGLLALALLFCLIWASAFTVAKIGLADAPPKLFLGVRFLLAGLLLLGLAAWREGRALLTWRALGIAVLLGLLNNAIYLGFSHHAMARISSGLASVIISTNPILTGFLAALLLRERLGLARLAGLGLGLFGVWWILRHRVVMGDDPLGLAYAVAAVLSMVLGTVLFKRLGGGLGLVWSTGLQCLSAGLALLPLGLWLEGWESLHWTPRFIGSLAYQVLAVSIGGYLLWLHLLRQYSATAASSYHFLIPPLGLGLGWLVLGEAVNPADLIGCLPIVLGIYLVNRPARP
ncbi:MAG: DMT family transporter [Ferrovibrio sp.]|nr:DMT family transporter [Ferrovibrio sp.]